MEVEKYRTIVGLAKGPYGEVLKVEDCQSKINLTKKIIKITSEYKLSYIKNQIELLKGMGHPNIVKIYDQYIEQNQLGVKNFHVIIEYIQGDILIKHLKKLNTENIILIYYQIKSILEFLNYKKVLHRDIKLDNLMIDKNNQVKLIDFGILRELKISNFNEKKQRAEDHYKAPELFGGSKSINLKSDLWTFAIILIEMTTGEEIYKIYPKHSGQHPQEFKKFVQASWSSLNINKQILKLILPLLEQDYKKRDFYHQENQNPNSAKKLQFKLSKLKDYDLELKLQKFKNILELNCSNCYLTDPSGKIISHNCLSLLILNVSGNNLTDLFIKNISTILHKLTLLNVSFTNITDESLFILSQIKKKNSNHQVNLESLDISYTKVTSKGIMRISTLFKLKQLAIWSGQGFFPYRYYQHIYLHYGMNEYKYRHNSILINQECLEQLCKMNFISLCLNLQKKGIGEILSKVSIPYCLQIIGQFVEGSTQKIFSSLELQSIYLKQITLKLKSLSISSKKLINVSFIKCLLNIKQITKELAKSQQLFHLDLSFCKIGKLGAIQIANNLPSLQSLFLPYNEIGKEGAIQIANKLKNLKVLSLASNNIRNEGVIKISQKLKNLESLLLFNNNITKQGVIQIGKNLSELIVLDLSENEITKEGITQICRNLKKLKTLILSKCNLDRFAAEQISTYLRNLSTLILVQNQIGSQGALQIAKHMTDLDNLNLENNGIGKEAAIQLADNLKNLYHLT